MVLLALILGFYIYYRTVVRPIADKLCEETAQAKVIDAINLSNDVLMAQKIFYEDYFKISYDKDNKISGIIANSGLINQINMIMQTEIQNRIELLCETGMSLPVGALTGSPLLTGYGKEIPITVRSVSNCYTLISSKFESAGINQTKHSLIITAYVDIELLSPLKSIQSEIINDVIIAEAIIVGEVPSTYLSGFTTSDYLNLVS